MLVALGLFTISWERLANFALGPYNVKLPVLMFCAAALLLAGSWFRWVVAAVRGRRTVGSLSAVLLLIGLVIVVRAAAADPVGPAAAQVAAMLTGAVLPALALVGLLRTAEDVAWSIRWLLAGAVAASCFGVYQLLAFYAGLPQGIVYTGVGTSGSGGRIAAFNYEPAYFAYFLVLILGALFALAQIEQRKPPWASLVALSFVLTLVNVRALVFVLPILLLLLLVAWRRNSRLLGRALIAGAVGGALAFFVPIGLAGLVQLAQSPQEPSAVNAAPARTAAVSAPRLPSNILDPKESSSNAPRLDLYRAVLAVDMANPFVGVGPGGLRAALQATGYLPPNQGAVVVANNIWLQAGADGGFLLVSLQAVAVLVVVILWWRQRGGPAHALLSAWLAVVLVGGMLTSYFFDIKVWVFLALAVGLAASRTDASGQRVPAAA